MTNNFFLSHNIFVYAIVPLALVPIEIQGGQEKIFYSFLKISFSLSNPCKTFVITRSWIFVSAISFGALIVLSSSLQPSWSLEWFFMLAGCLLSIAFFLLITARLALEYENFYESFFTVVSILAAINALINLNDYFSLINPISSFAEFRFSPTYGRVPDHFPTTGAMTYASCLVGAGGLIMINSSIYRKVISFVCLIILFIALVLTQSRGPLFGAILAITVSFLVVLKQRRIIFLFLPSFAAGIFLIMPKIGAHAIERLDNHRLEVWRRFIDLIVERPILGYGERIEFIVEINDGQKFGHAHNIFMSSIMRGGILAFLALAVSYGFAVLKTLQFSKRFNNPIPLGLILLILIAGIVDFDQLVFFADWQWLCFWFPLGLSTAADMRLREE